MMTFAAFEPALGKSGTARRGLSLDFSFADVGERRARAGSR